MTSALVKHDLSLSADYYLPVRTAYRHFGHPVILFKTGIGHPQVPSCSILTPVRFRCRRRLVMGVLISCAISAEENWLAGKDILNISII